MTRRVALVALATLLLGGTYAVTTGRLGLPGRPATTRSSPAAAARPAPEVRITDRTGTALLADLRAGTPGQPATTPFLEYVEEELAGLRLSSDRPLTVTSTLDAGPQAAAEQTVRDAPQQARWRDPDGQVTAAVVAVEPATGEIEAMAGPPAGGGQPNAVSQAIVSPGTAVLPFTYALAIAEHRATMDTRIEDSPSPYVFQLPGGDNYSVWNFDRRSHGSLALQFALGSELPIPAVKVETAAGIPALVEFDRRLGLDPRLPDGSRDGSATAYGPSLTLGGYPVTLLEEVAALSVLAAGGVSHRPEAILRVTDGAGRVLYGADPARGAGQVLDPGVAYIVAGMLANDDNRVMIYGRGTPIHLPDRRAAAIVGTAENGRDFQAAGFTPDLAAVVWVGDSQGAGHKLGPGSDGVFVAAPGWHAFMEQALQGVPDRWYAAPGDVVQQGTSVFLAGTPRIDRL